MSNMFKKSILKLIVNSPSLNIGKYLSYSLFDESFYNLKNKTITSKSFNQYIEFGHAEGRCPHPLFDPVYYKCSFQKNKNIEPLKDYMSRKGEIVSPHILFDADYYASHLDKIPKNKTLLEHFLDEGWKKNFSPTPYFDFNFYCASYPDIKNAGLNPLVHYLIHGEDEGRKPNNNFDPGKYDIPIIPMHWNREAFKNRSKLTFYVSTQEDKMKYITDENFIQNISKVKTKKLPKNLNKYQSIFDALFFEGYYSDENWDIDMPPIDHYLQYGSKEGRNPNPLFDPKYYKEKYLSNQKANNNLEDEPIVHYYRQPHDKQISPHPLFDAEYYYSQLQEKEILVSKDQTYLEHFFKEGWKYNLSPSKHFDVEFYIEQYPDIKKSKVNPILHYLKVGESLGLQPNADFTPAIIVKPYLEQNKNNPVYITESKLAMHVKGELNLPAELISFKSDLRLILDKNKPTIVFVTHETSRTGAPAIILKLAQQFKKYLDVNIISLSGYGGDMEADFRVLGPFYKFNNWCAPHLQLENKNLMDEIGNVLNIINIIKPVGALINSAESRNVISHFKFRNIPTIALVHEMAYFYPKETFKEITVNADFTIFPSQIVQEFANGNEKFNPDKITVRGQGLLKPEILEINKEKAKVNLRKMLHLPEDAFVVMGCGSLTKRKAPEFFIHTAIHVIQFLRKEEIIKQNTSVKKIYDLNEKSFTELSTKLKSHSKKRTSFEKKEIHFVWLGGNTETCTEDYFWIDQDIIMTGCETYIHFIGTKPDAEKYFAGSDVFLMTSRADPFPCVIHEAMAAELPIVGFKDAGGFVEAINTECGEVVEYADTKAAAECILNWYKNPDLKEKLGENAKQRVQEKYNYLDYTIDVATILFDQADKHLNDSKLAKLAIYKSNLKTLQKQNDQNQIEIKERKKVIFTLPAWEISGVNTFVENLIADLNNRGYNAYLLFTSNHALYTRREFMPDIPYRFLGSDEIYPERWKKFIDYMESEAPCVFVPNYDYFASAICPALSNDISILGVLHSDDYEHYEHAYRLGLFWNRMVSVSKVIEKKMLDYNPRFKEMSSVIYYGIDAPLKRKMPTKRETFSIVYTGRIVKVQKRILDFIEIVEKLEKTGIDYIFTFIGDGPDYWEFKIGMEEMAKRNNIKEDKIRILARQPIEKVYDELSKAHAFALCSDFEGLPLSLLEALSFYCVPVVTEIESGITEVLEHNKSGLISKIGDADGFVKNLVNLASDVKLQKKLGENAFKVLAEYKLRQQDMGEQYAKIIEIMFSELEAKTYKRPVSLNVTKDKNILLPPTFQKIPHGFDEKGKVFF